MYSHSAVKFRLLQHDSWTPGTMLRRGEVTLRRLVAPIQDVLDEPTTSEVVVNRPGQVGWNDSSGRWHWRDVSEFDYDRLDAISIPAGTLMGKTFDPAHPSITTTLSSGARLTAVQHPMTDQGIIAVNIRVPHSASTDGVKFDFDDLVRDAENRLDRGPTEIDLALRRLHAVRDWRAFFPLAVKGRKTIGITGEMFTGKTSFIREWLVPHIDPLDRVVTIEDSAEYMKFPHIHNRVSLYHGEWATANDCFEICLRQRADRILLQELRGPEILPFMRILASGHSGSFTTWHADEGDPWTALKLMVPTNSAQSDDKVEAILRAFVDVIVHCRRDPQTNRLSVSSVYLRGAE